MMGLQLPHLIILAVLVLILFGRGRISEMMGDFGKGIKSFKKGMSEEAAPPPPAPPAPQITAPAPEATTAEKTGETGGTGQA